MSCFAYFYRERTTELPDGSSETFIMGSYLYPRVLERVLGGLNDLFRCNRGYIKPFTSLLGALTVSSSLSDRLKDDYLMRIGERRGYTEEYILKALSYFVEKTN